MGCDGGSGLLIGVGCREERVQPERAGSFHHAISIRAYAPSTCICACLVRIAPILRCAQHTHVPVRYPQVSRLLLLSGAAPDHPTEFLGGAPLAGVFASRGLLDMVALLAEFGANLDATSASGGLTPLMFAARQGHLEVHISHIFTLGSPAFALHIRNTYMLADGPAVGTARRQGQPGGQERDLGVGSRGACGTS